jgi:hypothetical protein
MSREPSEPEDGMLLENRNAVIYGAGGAIGIAVLPTLVCHAPTCWASIGRKSCAR